MADLSLSREADLQLERQLKTLNKPAIKTFKTQEGDTIDCVDINKQPALDHPLLKNHKVQTRPVTFPTGSAKKSSKSKTSYIRHERESCPDGTVPIRRTSKEDLIKAGSMPKESMTQIGPQTSFPAGHRFHTVNVGMKKDVPYFGVDGRLEVWNLTVAKDQYSFTNMWIQNGPPDQLNVILAGWTVSPAINGDQLTRLFTFWTADGARTTGCYNQLCPGFVLTNCSITPNYPLLLTSTYEEQYDIKILIYQDQPTGNWWLVLSDDNVFVGYWPKELFNHLSGGAETVAWGGIAIAGKNGVSPPMGSGLLNLSFRSTCYIRNIQYVDTQNKFRNPDGALEQHLDRSTCYGLKDWKNCGRKEMYYCILFGGEGGRCGD
ncbi:NEP-interacting protein 1 [Citrus sinensis]|nr:NEP-interacting protein 1 [Citrus sinensis]